MLAEASTALRITIVKCALMLLSFTEINCFLICVFIATICPNLQCTAKHACDPYTGHDVRYSLGRYRGGKGGVKSTLDIFLWTDLKLGMMMYFAANSVEPIKNSPFPPVFHKIDLDSLVGITALVAIKLRGFHWKYTGNLTVFGRWILDEIKLYPMIQYSILHHCGHTKKEILKLQ